MFKSLKISFVEKLTVLVCLSLIGAASIVSIAPGSASAKEIRLFQTPSSKFNSPMSISPTTSYLRISADRVADARNSSEFVLPGVQIFAVDDAGKVTPVTLTLELREFTVIGPRTQITLVGADGEKETSLPTVKTYRGRIQGETDSRAFLAIEERGVVTGRIEYEGQDYNIGFENHGEGMCAITATTMIPNYRGMMDCGTPESGVPTIPTSPSKVKSLKSGENKPLALKAILMALDCDKEALDHFGGEAGLKDYVTARFAAISTIYEEDLGVEVNIGKWEINTTPGPTFNSQNAALDWVGKKWYDNRKTIDRTVAHYISRQDMGNPGGAMGLAWLNQLCEKGHQNGGSSQIAGGYANDRIMGSNQFPTIDENVIAHELGHNVASPHTHDCTWEGGPIDSCAGPDGAGGANSGTCYSTSQRKQTKGSIMSYCNNTNFTFKHPGRMQVVDLMKSAIEAHDDCLPQGLGGATALTLSTKELFIDPPAPGKDSVNVNELFVKNAGTTKITVTGGVVNGINKSDFHLIASEYPFDLAAGASKAVTITFKPLLDGIRKANITFNNSAGIPTRVDVKAGTGIDKPLPDVEYLQRYIDWGEVLKCNNCYKDSVISFMVNNTENDVSMTTPKIGGPNKDEFTIITGASDPVLKPGVARVFKIRYTANSVKLGQKKAFVILSHALSTTFDTIPLYAKLVTVLSGVDEADARGLSIDLQPNPFRESLSMTLSLQNDLVGKDCQVEIFDNLGRSVAVLNNSVVSTPVLDLNWRPQGIAAGQYRLVATVDDRRIEKTVVYTK